MPKPTLDQLEELAQTGKATCAVYEVNHREYVSNGVRYYFGWNSTRKPGRKTVIGWVLYKDQPEPPEPHLKSIAALAEMGEFVAGLKVDIRTRNAHGELHYPDQHPPQPIFTKLKAVYWKREHNGRWLYWEWEQVQSFSVHTRSGVHESLADEYYLEVHPS